MGAGLKYDLIIIGGGPAGMTAGIYAARKKLKTLILTRDIGGQAAWSSDIENYIGFTMISGSELTKKFEHHLEEFKDEVELRLVNSGVKKLQQVTDGFVVTTGDNQSERARAVIIASGRLPRKLGVEGEDKFLNRGITYCAWCDGPIFAGKDIAVVGGGNSALDAALNVAKIVKQIYIINIEAQLTGDQIMIEKVNEAHNIRIINQSEVKQIKGDKFVSGVQIVDHSSGTNKDLAVEGVFIEAGSIPATDYLAGVIKLTHEKEIVIDKDNMTSIEGIFAAGDVTDVIEKQIVIAAGEGAKAAIAAARWLAKK